MALVMERWCPTQQMLGVFLMKKVFLAGVAVLALAGTAHAEIPKFQSLANYSLECESSYQDRKHLTLEILPSEWTLKLHNEKGEIFSFRIDKVNIYPTPIRNEFNHEVMVPYVAYIEFRDNSGQLRMIMHRKATVWDNGRYSPEDIVYMPGPHTNQHWAYSCIPQ
jgi:hypothetical protein